MPEVGAIGGSDAGAGTSIPTSLQQPISTSTSSSSSLPAPPPTSVAPSGKPQYKGKHGEIVEDSADKRGKCSVYWRGSSEVNTWYRIDESGSRILETSFKPPGIGSKVWAKMTEEQKLEAIAKHSSSTAGVVIEYAPLGVLGLENKALAAQVIAWSNDGNKLQ